MPKMFIFYSEGSCLTIKDTIKIRKKKDSYNRGMIIPPKSLSNVALGEISHPQSTQPNTLKKELSDSSSDQKYNSPISYNNIPPYKTILTSMHTTYIVDKFQRGLDVNGICGSLCKFCL